MGLRKNIDDRRNELDIFGMLRKQIDLRRWVSYGMEVLLKGGGGGWEWASGKHVRL